jgi:hypothetical protein
VNSLHIFKVHVITYFLGVPSLLHTHSLYHHYHKKQQSFRAFHGIQFGRIPTFIYKHAWQSDGYEFLRMQVKSTWMWDLAEWLERCASIPNITGLNPSGGSELTFRSDLLLTAWGGSTWALIEFACLLCYLVKILCSQRLEPPSIPSLTVYS